MMGLFTKDENGAPAPGMAESEEKSEDGLTLTFHIREDAVWANGDPVTAHDFVYAWRRVAIRRWQVIISSLFRRHVL